LVDQIHPFGSSEPTSEVVKRGNGVEPWIDRLLDMYYTNDVLVDSTEISHVKGIRGILEAVVFGVALAMPKEKVKEESELSVVMMVEVKE
jgi:hypothetical protein